MVETIDAFIRNNSYAQNFVDVVTDDIAPDYLNVIAVEMNLYTIRFFLESIHYRSKEMLMNDLKLIELNSTQFNGDGHKITKDAKQVYDNLKKTFDKTLTYKLRSVPQRSVTTRSRDVPNPPELESRQNKRNPKKVTPKQKRSSRKNGEENKSTSRFKKPTPQKHREKFEDEDSDLSQEEKAEFKIELSGADSNLRRSTRSRAQVSYKEPEDQRQTRQNRRRDTKAKNKRREEFEESEEMESAGNRRRNTRRKVSHEESEFTSNNLEEEDDDFDPSEYD